MSTVYVMITCNVGFEKAVIEVLKTVNLIKEIKGVMGTYDILVKLESDSNDELENVTSSKIRKIPNIRTTLTLTVIESQA